MAEAARLRTLILALVRRFALSERADVECCGLTVAQAAALEALAGGEATRLGPLARGLGIAPSTLTRNLERLEQDGLVRREADEQDGRAARVRLTAAGERAAERVAAQEVAFAADVLKRLGRERADRTLAALGDLLQAVRAASEQCCPGAFDHLMDGVALHAGEASRRSRERKSCCD
jgi:DNA-binding MarR family transcriptional regulator